MRRVAETADGWLPFEQTAGMAAVTGTPELGKLADRTALLREKRSTEHR